MAVGALRVAERNAAVYRRTWRGTLFMTFLSPILYLATMGLGLGGFVDRNGTLVEGVSYLTFLAPGLLAAQAMNTASFECTYPVLGMIVWQRTFEGMLVTPLGVRGLLGGLLAWVTVRLTMVATVFLTVIFVFGASRSPAAVAAIPVAVLTGLAFAAPLIAFTATQKNDNGFAAVFRFGVTPLFLFSGTFFPVERLPAFIQPIAWVTPLYHGVELTRGIMLGRAEPASAVVHLLVLVAFVVGGTVGAGVLLRRRLLK